MRVSGYTAELSLKTQNEYLSVNVYPTLKGWMCVTMIHRTGKPYARLIGRVVELPLPESTRTYADALEAAADRLLALAEEVSQAQPRSGSGVPGGTIGATQ